MEQSRVLEVEKEEEEEEEEEEPVALRRSGRIRVPP